MAWVRVLVVGVLASVLLACTVHKKQPLKVNVKPSTPALTRAVHEKFTPLTELLSAEPIDFNRAGELVDALIAFCEHSCSPYEQASLQNIIGYFHEQKGDITKALEHYDLVLTQPEALSGGLYERTIIRQFELAISSGLAAHADFYFTKLQTESVYLKRYYCEAKLQLRWLKQDYEEIGREIDACIILQEAEHYHGLASVGLYKLKHGNIARNNHALAITRTDTDLVIDAKTSDDHYRSAVTPYIVYPREARDAKITGSCTVEFDINPEGAPRNIKMLESTAQIFNESCTLAARQIRYKPMYTGGLPVSIQGVQYQFTFNISSD